MKEKICALLEQIYALQQNKDEALKLPDNTFYMDNDLILSGVRRKGVSRYPYARDGLVVWASHNGYITANESEFVIFRPSLTDEIPCTGFFMGIEFDGDFYPISADEAGAQVYSPVKVDRYTVYSPEAAYYIADTPDLTFCNRLFVDKNKRINFTLFALNKSNKEQKIYLSAFYEGFLRFSQTEDFWNKSGRDTKKLDNGNFVFHTSDRTEAYMAANVRIEGNCTAHYGTTSMGDIGGASGRPCCNGLSLLRGKYERNECMTKRTEMPAMGDMVHFTIPAGETARVDHSFTYTFNKDEAYKIANDTTLPSGNFEKEIEELEKEEIKGVENMEIKFDDWKIGDLDPRVVTRFYRTVQRQTSFCAFGKCYAGPMLGVRDVFQQLEGALIWNPEAARKQIVCAFGYIDPSGRPPRQFTIPPTEDLMPNIDSRRFIDQGVWMIDTVYTYLAYTGDYSILDEICGYYNLPTENSGFAWRCDRKDSLLDHMLQIMTYLLENLDKEYGTNCLRIIHGDWNDSVDGIGKCIDGRAKYGSGVSVMATLQLYRCLKEMNEILAHIGRYEEKIPEYNNYRDMLREGFFKYAVQTNDKGEKRIVHGWGDKLSYFVGSFKDSDGVDRISFASNAFYAISGMVNDDDSLKQTAIDAIKSLDSRFGLLTNWPQFYKTTPGVGRIATISKGSAENACAYVHGSLFQVCALFAMGESEFAWDRMQRAMVISHPEPSLTSFAMPNSYMDNEEFNQNGESAGDWFTGSGTVLVKGTVKYGFGVKPNLDGVVVEMPNSMPANSASLDIIIKGNPVKIIYKNKNNGERKYIVNGKEYETQLNPITATKFATFKTEQLKDLVIEVID